MIKLKNRILLFLNLEGKEIINDGQEELKQEQHDQIKGHSIIILTCKLKK
jgi:hypothetical protein